MILPGRRKHVDVDVAVDVDREGANDSDPYRRPYDVIRKGLGSVVLEPDDVAAEPARGERVDVAVAVDVGREDLDDAVG